MSDYRLVVAVSNPASGDPLIRMGSALARANNECNVWLILRRVPIGSWPNPYAIASPIGMYEYGPRNPPH